jgi:hypothetical protein
LNESRSTGAATATAPPTPSFFSASRRSMGVRLVARVAARAASRCTSVHQILALTGSDARCSVLQCHGQQSTF